MMVNVDWEWQARKFLEFHGWEFEDGFGSHPCFPLLEDFSVNGVKDFCEDFYGEAWKVYTAMVKSQLLLSEKGN